LYRCKYLKYLHTPFSSKKYFPDISSLCYWIFYMIFMNDWFFLDKMFPIPTEILLCIQISMIIYLFIYLFHFTSLVRAQTMWALATSNGVFLFFFFFHSVEIYLFISPRMAEKNPNPMFRTITFMTFTL